MPTIRFPGETPAYRAARNELLEAERDLRKRTEEVAALRRRLPLGAALTEDYLFEEGAADLEDTTSTRKVSLAGLFDVGKDTLVVYNYMFAPDAKAPCPMCTCFLDSLDGNALHIGQRVSLAVVAKSPIARIRELARSRGWRNLRLVSSGGTTFNTDFHGESPDGSQNSIIHVFVKREEKIHHSYSCELQAMDADPGENSRHIDAMWPVWNVLDLTPAGRGSDWFPKLKYG